MNGKTKRVASGSYLYTVNGRTFAIEEISWEIGQSRKQWNISEVVDGIQGAPFDAAETLGTAKLLADIASEN